MPGRIDNDIKNRFNASLKKFKNVDEYCEQTDKKIHNRNAKDKSIYENLRNKSATPRRARGEAAIKNAVDRTKVNGDTDANTIAPAP